MAGLSDIEEALSQVLAEPFPNIPSEDCALGEALGRVLAEPVCAGVDVPFDDNSAMDGYALKAAECDRRLRVTQRIAAGSCGTEVVAGTAARIFTGAPVPTGADAVVMQENCELEGDFLRLTQAVRSGENIRRAGQDIPRGTTVFEGGRRLRAEDLGVLASVGRGLVKVRRRLRVAILSTGDELVEPTAGVALKPGQIFNSNRYTLRGLLRALAVEVLDFGVVPDTAEATRETLREAAMAADCVVSSGGVSVGEEDHVKNQLEQLGQLRLWKLRIKPGKPLAWGRIGDTAFFGLPGNPAAVYVTFSLIVRPWLLQQQGAQAEALLALPARAAFSIDRAGSRQEYLRARLQQVDGELVAHLHENQSSGVLSAVSWANALVVLPPGTTVAPGDGVQALLLDQLNR